MKRRERFQFIFFAVSGIIYCSFSPGDSIAIIDTTHSRWDPIIYLFPFVNTVPASSVPIEGVFFQLTRRHLLIDAIKISERDHSVLPQSCSELVPDYNLAVPVIGMKASPEDGCDAGDKAKIRYGSKVWGLSLFMPSSGINFDMMLSCPHQSFPKQGYCGQPEPVGDWAIASDRKRQACSSNGQFPRSLLPLPSFSRQRLHSHKIYTP